MAHQINVSKGVQRLCPSFSLAWAGEIVMLNGSKRCDIMKSYLQIGLRNTDSQDIMADGSSKWMLSRLSQVEYQSSRLQSKSIYSLYLCLRLSNRNVLRIIFRFVSRCVSCGNTRSVQMISKVSRLRIEWNLCRFMWK